MSEPNLGGLNSRPTDDGSKYVDPITPDVDEVISELPEVEAEVTEEEVADVAVTEEEVADVALTDTEIAEVEVTEAAVPETPLTPLMTNTSYTSPAPESTQPEVEESGLETSIEAQPKEEVQRSLTEPELRERIQKLTSEIDELVDVASKSDAAMESEGENLEERIRVQEDFTHWVAKRRSSYAWHLLSRLETHKKNL